MVTVVADKLFFCSSDGIEIFTGSTLFRTQTALPWKYLVGKGCGRVVGGWGVGIYAGIKLSTLTDTKWRNVTIKVG